MKKFLTIALAAFAFIACNDNNIDDVTGGGVTGEMETSYIAINLNAADNTRADEDVPAYQDGLDAERAVKTAYFFFFDDEGNAFPVTGGSPATAPGGTVNWISANLQDLGQGEKPNVSDIKDAVLVLSTYEGDFPSQIVAVINWVPTANTAYSLNELYAATDVYNSEVGGFVMSNAVYSDGTKAVVGTPLAETDIFKSPADALANPITIHVERIAAKVTVTAKDDVVENRFQVKKNNNNVSVTIGSSNIDVYVKVEGWGLHNDFTQSKLLKEINPTWSGLGFNWNDPDYFRCYWATSLTGWEEGENAFPTNFTLGLGNQTNVNKGTYADNTYTYVGENTLYDTTNNGSTANCTKVILKAKLQQKTAENTYVDLPLARWYTTYYAGTVDLLKAVANTIKYQYCWESSGEYTYISYEDLTVVQEGNLVKFQLSSNSEDKNWRVINSDKSYTPKSKDEMNALLGGLEKALYYDKGDTLYYIDIAHLGNLGNNIPEAGDYGVVRNHIYNVVLKSFGGFGSPVYIPGSGNLEYPEDPLDTGEYVSAEVRILSWRLVSQEVDVQP